MQPVIRFTLECALNVVVEMAAAGVTIYATVGVPSASCLETASLQQLRMKGVISVINAVARRLSHLSP